MEDIVFVRETKTRWLGGRSASSWIAMMRERDPRNVRWERRIYKMKIQMQHLLEVQQCWFDLHFAITERHPTTAGVSLRGGAAGEGRH
jgi:hypothetical protein